MNEFRGLTNQDQWVQAAKKGSLQDFNRLAAEYSDDVYTLAFALTGEEQAALEVSQQALAAAFLGLRSLEKASLRSWLLAKTIDASRRRGVHLAHLPGVTYGLQTRLENISEQCRLVLLLVDVLGLSYQEASGAIGCSVEEVRRRLATARRQIL